MPDFTAENTARQTPQEFARLQAELEEMKQQLLTAQHELKRAQRAPVASPEAAANLLSTVTHDLRTPLSAILLWTSLIEDEKVLEAAQLAQALRAIKDSAEELSALVEKLGAEARALAGKSTSPSPATKSADAERPSDGGAGAALARCHILLIEDIDGTREALAGHLQRLGATVDGVDSAAAAWEAMDRKTPDVILTDLTLPTIDAADFIRQLRESEANNSTARVPAFALTSESDEVNSAEILRQGFQGTLLKSADSPKLVATITTALTSRNARRVQP